MNVYLKTAFWLAIAAYVFTLPYAIVVFNFLRETLTLELVKKLPSIMAVLALSVFFYLVRDRNKRFLLIYFAVPVSVLLAAVAFLESNPIKYTHIPEYAFLTWLVFLALGENSKIALVTAVIFASILGVIDEFHHGIHPERYFGWKDMIINTIGAVIGALVINAMKSTPYVETNFELRQLRSNWTSIILVLMAAVFCFVSVDALFLVVDSPSWADAYSAGLVNLNIIGIFLCLMVVLFQGSSKSSSGSLKESLILASIIFGVLQAIILFANFNAVSFR